MRNVLLVTEVALSIVLLVGAALLVRSFARLTSVDPGFDPQRVLAFRVSLPATSYPEDHHRDTFYDRLLGQLRTSAGVEAVGAVQTLPMSGGYVLSFEVEGRPAEPGAEESANYRAVTPEYFAALGIPVLRGRAFTPQDHATAPMVAVVDAAFAQKHFPDEDPMGRGIDVGNGTDGFFQIVGVVGTVHHEGLDATPAPTMYVPVKQDMFSTMWVLMRTAGDPAQFATVARQAVRDVDGALPAYSMAPLTSVVSDSVAQRRFSRLLLAVFAGVALFLAAVGLYGVVAYAVSQRTQEIGLRMAIGAQRGDVLRMVLSSGMELALIGVVIGIAGALALARSVGRCCTR